MLIVRRVKIRDVEAFQFPRNLDSIFPVYFQVRVEIAENRLFKFYFPENASERVFSRRAETSYSRVLVLVETFENSARVHMNRSLRYERREKKFFQGLFLHNIVNQIPVGVNQKRVFTSVENPLSYLNVAVIFRRVILRNYSADFFFVTKPLYFDAKPFAFFFREVAPV